VVRNMHTLVAITVAGFPSLGILLRGFTRLA